MKIKISGDKESGKTTLIAKLQANEDPKKGAGLEYGYIDVRDEYRDGKKQFGWNFYKTFYYIVNKTGFKSDRPPSDFGYTTTNYVPFF